MPLRPLPPLAIAAAGSQPQPSSRTCKCNSSPLRCRLSRIRRAWAWREALASASWAVRNSRVCSSPSSSGSSPSSSSTRAPPRPSWLRPPILDDLGLASALRWLAREFARVFQGVAAQRQRLGEAVVQRGLGGIERRLQFVQAQLERGEVLADAVVQVAGDAAAFVFLHPPHRAAEAAEFAFVALQALQQIAIERAQFGRVAHGAVAAPAGWALAWARAGS